MQLLENVAALSLEERRSKLKEMLVNEKEVMLARKTVDRQELATWFTAEQAIPCVLHCLMRVMERVYWGLFEKKIDAYLVS